jgi:ribonuclease BN (tRNA processing enzyme)
MQLIVLGSGTSVFHPRRASAGFWLQTNQGSLLLDCSADAPHRMAEEKLDWPQLDAIWISHLHLDHCGGLAPFLFGIKWLPGIRKRRKPLRIIGCQGLDRLVRAIDDSDAYKLFEQPFPLEFHEIGATDKPTSFEVIEGLQAHAISTPHRPESLALSISGSNGAKLVYSSDTGYSESLAKFGAHADLLILECSFYQNKPTSHHLELADAMQIARAAEPRKLLLTHLYPEWDGIELASEAKKLWPGQTIEARDGLRINV